jgi:hypothetical protein
MKRERNERDELWKAKEKKWGVKVGDKKESIPNEFKRAFPLSLLQDRRLYIALHLSLTGHVNLDILQRNWQLYRSFVPAVLSVDLIWVKWNITYRLWRCHGDGILTCNKDIGIRKFKKCTHSGISTLYRSLGLSTERKQRSWVWILSRHVCMWMILATPKHPTCVPNS